MMVKRSLSAWKSKRLTWYQSKVIGLSIDQRLIDLLNRQAEMINYQSKLIDNLLADNREKENFINAISKTKEG
ncbi:hypothetical protein [Sporolactobacillus terrae]|uniref:hypothetical protein n=1 Tax=Sporolactobacillus terrae TaxID=269673 RepID=UPI0018CC502B|nr:hypothetical protein [Sporolactobacillus terrae]